MSELALDYYQQRADELGIDFVPVILRGQPVSLFEENQTVPVHKPELDHDSQAVRTLSESLRTTHGFILAGAPDYARYRKSEVLSVADKNLRFTGQFIGRLLIPAAVKTGKIDTVHIEALAREEVDDLAYKRIRTSSYGSAGDATTPPEMSEAYFGVSGRLRSGSRQIMVGGLLIARAVQAMVGGSNENTFYATTVHYGGTALRKNEVSGKLLQRESREVSEAIIEHNMRTAYKNAPGTSRRQRGSS